MELESADLNEESNEEDSAVEMTEEQAQSIIRPNSVLGQLEKQILEPFKTRDESVRSEQDMFNLDE